VNLRPGDAAHRRERRLPETEPAAFRPEFGALLDRPVQFAGGDASTVVVLTIPDYTLTPAGQRLSPIENARHLEPHDRIVREAATDAGASVVDPPRFPVA
jgi:hypothetical protein